MIDTFRDRGATSPEKALTWRELGFPERLEHLKPLIPPDIDPIVRVRNRYYLSEERLEIFIERVGIPSSLHKWIQHTAKVPKGFLRYRVLHMLREHPMSGAELTLAIGKEMFGRWRPKPGSIYPLLKSLHRDGLTRELPGIDRRTRRYELTDKGIQFLDSEIDSSCELREKIEQGYPPFPPPFLEASEWLEKIPSSILHLFEALRTIPLVIMSDSSPETIEDLSRTADKFSAELERIRKKVESQDQVD